MADFDIHAKNTPQVIASELGNIVKQRYKPGTEKLYLCTMANGTIVSATKEQIAKLNLTRLPVDRIIEIVTKIMGDIPATDASQKHFWEESISILKEEKQAKDEKQAKAAKEAEGGFFKRLFGTPKPKTPTGGAAPDSARLELDQLRGMAPKVVRAQDLDAAQKASAETRKEFVEQSIKAQMERVDKESNCLSQTKTDADDTTFIIKDGANAHASPPPLVLPADITDAQQEAQKKVHLEKSLNAIDTAVGQNNAAKWRKPIQALCTQSPHNLLLSGLSSTMARNAADNELEVRVKATRRPIEMTLNRDATGAISWVDFHISGTLNLQSTGTTKQQMPVVEGSLSGRLSFDKNGELIVQVDEPNYQLLQS